MTNPISIRPIEVTDNELLARIVRATLTEFGADRPGSVYFDPSVDALYEVYQRERSHYFVALINGELVGGAGIYHTNGLPDEVVELSRVYLLPVARGLGLGKRLIDLCLSKARELAYRQIYLETTHEMVKGIPLYERMGFTYINAPLGNSGHFACDIWMLKSL